MVLDTSSESSSRWIIAGVSQQALIDADHFHIQTEPIVKGQVICGSVFRSKDSMLSAIHSYHLKNSVEFRTVKYDPKRYHIICKFDTTCGFLLRSLALGNAWKIKTLVAHSCAKDIRSCADPKVSARAIAAFVGPHMSVDGFVHRPCGIQGQVLRDFGVRLSYPSALSGRNRALKAIYGDEEKSFQAIAKYLYMLEKMNPGSEVDLLTGDDSKFKYCFFALSASIRAFRACRPVIVIDATHLNGKYKGVMFVASTKDGNEHIVPLAFGIGDKEKDESWTWFLEHVRKSFGTPENLLIVSDQHCSIKNVVEIVYPGTAHGFCTYHIQGNLRNSRENITETVQAAANAFKEDDYEEHMNNLLVDAPLVHAKLMGIGPECWAICKYPVRRFAFRTSNAVEVLNVRLKWGRQLPVTSLLEYARNLVQSWFYKRRTIADESVNEVTEFAEKRLGFSTEKAMSYNVLPISDSKFNIISGVMSNIVDLRLRDCSCKVFQMLLIPCSHAIAAMRFKKQSPIPYVHAYYSTDKWRQIYALEVMPVPDPSDWRVPNDIESRVVGTPSNPRQAGRPKKNRCPSGVPNNGALRKQNECPQQAVEMEEGAAAEVQKGGGRACSRCHKCGHYSTTCNEFIKVLPVDAAEEVVDGTNTRGVKRPRNPKKCGICGIVGHTRKKCQDPVTEPEL